MIAIDDVLKAQTRISDAVKRTPCIYAQVVSEALGANVFLKLENLQNTGSFKERGALNRLLTLTTEQKKNGVVAASAGNHAQGVACHANRLGIPATIVMPEGTPLVKVTRTAEYGGEVFLHGANYDESYAHAKSLALEKDAFLIHAYDDAEIIAGQGTVALEILEQCPDVDICVVPVGGGGLIAGIATVMAEQEAMVEVVGVEHQALPSMKAALESGGPVELPPAATIAEGIAVRRVGRLCHSICAEKIGRSIQVSDDEIARAILYLLEREKTVAEGAGAAGLAALLSRKMAQVKGKTIVVLVCGGNIDVNVISRVIEKGLVERGRLGRFSVQVRDRPGALAQILQLAAKTQVNVVEVHHERAFLIGELGEVSLDIVVETRGETHLRELKHALIDHGFQLLAE
jgi:threonine dehydratase